MCLWLKQVNPRRFPGDRLSPSRNASSKKGAGRSVRLCSSHRARDTYTEKHASLQNYPAGQPAFSFLVPLFNEGEAPHAS